MRVRRVLSLMVLVASGCGADESAAPAGGVPGDVLSVSHTIGATDEARPGIEFGRISGVAQLADGRVAVADALNQVIRVFEADGTYAFSFGRAGAGPGEFDGPCCLAVDERRRLWVRDGGNARYSFFDILPDSAAYIGQVRMSHGDVNLWAPVTFDDEGHVIDIGSRTDRTTGVTRRLRMHLDSTGRIVREEAVHKVPDDSTNVRKVERTIPGGVATMYAFPPFGPSELAAHSPNGEFAHALSSRYVIDWRAPDGMLIRTITGDIERGPALSAAEDSAGEERLAQLAERLDVGRTQLGFGVPSHKTPLRDLFFDASGRLWVELEVPDDAERRAHVYSSTGVLERTVTWPASISLAEGAIRGDIAWGVGRDSLDVPLLVRLRAPASGNRPD